MSAESAIESLKNLDFKEINSICSKNNLSIRVDEYSKKKFDTGLRTAYLLITQPIEIAISRQTKMDALQSLRDVKKILDSLYLSTKDQKYKNYLDSLNEIMTNSRVK